MPVILSRLNYFLTDFKYYLVIGAAASVVGFLILLLKRNRSILLLLAICYTLLAIFILGEFYYRYIFDASDNVFQLKTMQRWVQRHVIWNSDGYRDRHFSVDHPETETRIFFLGDSYTFGHGIANVADRYMEQLTARLQTDCSADKIIRGYNLARPGHQSLTHLETLKINLPRYQPNSVIMEYYLDDIDGDKLTSQNPGFEAQIFAYKHNPVLNFILSRSYALEYFYFRLLFLLRPDIDWGAYINFNESLYRNPQVWQRHLTTLTNVIQLTRQSGIPLVVFIIPLSHRLGPNYPLVDVHQQLVKFFRDQSVPTLDLLPILNQYSKEKLTVSRYDYHLNEFGHQLIADNLYQLVKDLPAFQCR